MATYRIKLDTIRCLQPRSAGEYHDTLNVTFSIAPSGLTPTQDMIISHPLGLRGPRMDIHFGPGDSFALVRNDNAFGYGRNVDWELIVDLPDDSLENWDISIILWNDRGIDDPYAVTKFVTALGLAAAGGAAGLALGSGEAKSFAAYVAAAAKGLGGEVIKKIVGSFFADWPKCAGIVFCKNLTWNRENFGHVVGSHTLESDPINAVPAGCHQPRYQVNITIQSEWIPQFGTSEKLRKRRYRAVRAPGRRKWVGVWHDSMSSPSITVVIEPAAQSGPSTYRVTIRETDVHQNSQREVEELNLREVFYSGRIINARATGFNQAVALEQATPRLQKLRRDVEEAALWKGAASVSQPSGSISDVLTTIKRFETLEEVRTGQAKKKFGSPHTLNRAAIEGVVYTTATEEGATLYIEAYGVTLRLYEVEDIMETGEVRRWGPILRYYRKPSLQATVADVQLGQYKLIK